MADNFFQGWIERVKGALDTNRVRGVFEVKHLRRVLDIDSFDRSKTIFLARALNYLVQTGYLKEIGSHSPKKYERNESGAK